MGTFQDTVKYLHRSGDGNVLQMVEVWLVLWSETRYSLVRLGMRTSGHQAVSTVGSRNGLTLPDWPKSLPISQPFHTHQNFLGILFLSSKNLQLIVLPQWLFRIWEAIGPLVLPKLHSGILSCVAKRYRRNRTLIGDRRWSSLERMVRRFECAMGFEDTSGSPSRGLL